MITYKNMKFSDVLNKYNKNTVYHDNIIQRKLGNWSDADKIDCLESYFRNLVSHPIVFADAQECLSWIESNEKLDEDSKQYYRDRIATGHRFVSLDGAHKLFDVIHGFVNGDYSYTGKIPCSSVIPGETPRSQEFTNTFYKDLPREYQQTFMNATTMTAVYEDLTAQELSTVFIKLQKGVPLNDQQIRRANRTKLTEWIMNLADNNDALWDRILKGERGPQSLAGSGDEEFIAKMLLATVTTWKDTLSSKTNKDFGLSKKELNQIYEAGIGVVPMFGCKSPYDASEFERVARVFNLYSSVVSGLFNTTGKTPKPLKIYSKAEQWMLWWAIEYIEKNGLTIKDTNDLYRLVQSLIAKLSADSHKAFAKAIDEAEDTGGEKPSESKYFHRGLNLPHQATHRQQTKEKFIEAFEEALKTSTCVMMSYAAAK
tara:strand:+ start:193 stop:1476 length:1284 start_codon:yes stop_codon:yes gene_type:complete